MIQTYKTLQKFSTFCIKLQRLLDSGIALSPALDSLIRDEETPNFKDRLQSFSAHLHEGNSVPSGLALLLPQDIPFNFGHMQSVGNLSLFLEKLATYYTKKTVYVASIVKKLAYPGFLLASMFGILGLLGGFLLPAYSTFYANMNLKLPLGLILIQRFLGIFSSVWAGYIVMLFGILVIWKFSTVWPRCKKWIFRCFFPENTGDILWMLSILLTAGVPLKQALTCIRFDEHEKQGKKFQHFQSQFLQTGIFSTSFFEHFTLTAYQKELLLHAQQSGKFAELLQVVGEELHSQEQKKFQFYLFLVQPILLLMMGILLFGCVYLMFVPVLSTLQQVL